MYSHFRGDAHLGNLESREQTRSARTSRDSGKASSSTIILQDFHILIYTMVLVDDGYIPRSTLYISKAKIVSLRELQLINFQLIMSLEMLDHGSD